MLRLLFLSLLLQAATGAFAATRYVGGCGSPSSPTIHDAVSAAVAGDTILVCPGTWNEQVTLDKDNLTLASSTGNRTDVTIRYDPATAVFIKGNNVTIKGLTIKSAGGRGAEVLWGSGGSHHFKDLVIDAGSDGILIKSAPGPHEFTNLQVKSSGHGIYLGWGASGAHTFNNVDVNAGGAGIISNSGAALFSGVKVDAQQTAIQIGTLHSTTFSGVDVKSRSSAGILVNQTHITYKTLHFSNVTVASNGDGIWIAHSGKVTMQNINVTSSSGNGIFLGWNSQGKHQLNQIRVSADGYGLYIRYGFGSISDITVDSGGGAIWIGNRYPGSLTNIRATSTWGRGITLGWTVSNAFDFSFSDIDVTSDGDGIYIRRAGKIDMNNVSVTSANGDGIEFNWGVAGKHKLRGMAIRANNGRGIVVPQGVDTLSAFSIVSGSWGVHAYNLHIDSQIDNGNIQALDKAGILFGYGPTPRKITVEGVSIKAKDRGIEIHRGGRVRIRNVCVDGATDGIRIIGWDVSNIEIRDSRFSNYTKYGVAILSNPASPATVTGNAFLKASKPRAVSNSTAHHFDGNYWEGVPGGTVYVDGSVVDHATLGSDPVSGCYSASTGPLVLSTKKDEVIGTLAFEDEDLVDYPGSVNGTSLYLEGDTIFKDDEDIDAAHVLPDGRIALSTDKGASIRNGTGWLSIKDEDVVLYDPTTGTSTLLLDGSAVFSGKADVDAVHVISLSPLRILLSTTKDEQIGSLKFRDEDIVLYDTSTGTATLYFDGSAVFADDEDVDGVHLLPSGKLLISTTNQARIGFLVFDDDDVVEYDPATGAASLYFRGSAVISTGGDLDAITLKPSPGGPVLDHFHIDVGGGSQSTCVPVPITIMVHDSSHNVITSYTGTISLSTSSGHGTWSVNTASGTLSDPTADDGAATYTFVAADNGSIVLDLSNVHADDLTITVSDGSAGVSDTSATVSFRDDTFVVTPTDALGSEVVAGRNHGFKAELWRRDPTTGTCAIATAYDGTFALKAWITRDAADPGGAAPAIGGVPLPDAAPGSNNLNLAFARGVANFTLATTDVGKYALALRDDTSGFAKDASGNPRPIDGGSTTLTVRPFGLSLEGIRAGTTTNPGTTTPTGTVFTKAGSPFQVTVRAVRWQAADDANDDGAPDAGAKLTDNATTAAYAWQTSLSAGAPYEPAGGTLGALARGGTGAAVVQASEFSSGTATVTDLGYGEVGAFTLGASAGGYLGTAGVDVTAVGVTVGRFTPFDFAVALNTPQFDTFCDAGAFTYLGQAFGYAVAPQMTVTARNAQGGTTRNYTGAWLRLTHASLGLPSYAAAAGTLDLSGLPSSGDPAITDNGNGTATLTFSAGSGLRFARGASPVVPFDAEIALSLNVVDEDGVAYAGNPARFGDASAGNGIAFDGGKSMRWGRIALDSAHGPEVLPLSLPLRIEYWGDPDGDGVASFVTHTDDTCTTVAAAAVRLGNYTGNLDAADLDGDGDGNPDVSVTLSAGAGSVALTKAPGIGNDGSVEVTVDAPAHLEFDWKGAGDTDPTARATYGVYHGDDYRIYQRELY